MQFDCTVRGPCQKIRKSSCIRVASLESVISHTAILMSLRNIFYIGSQPSITDCTYFNCLSPYETECIP